MGHEHTAAVVTAPFWLRDPETLARALGELERLDVDPILVVHDARGPSEEPTRRAVREARSRAGPSGPRLVILPVRAGDTALRWRRGVDEAFRTAETAAVFLFPGDLTSEPDEENRAGWVRMLTSGASDRLVLGDFRSPDEFKTGFDALVLRPLIRALHPELDEAVEGLGLSKLRTEFLVVGRTIYEEFRDRGERRWGPDPTPQLTLAVLASRGPGSVVVEPTGEVADDPDARVPLGRLFQIVRIAGELVVDRVCQGVRGALDESGPDAVERYVESRHAIARAFSATLDAVDENLVRSIPGASRGPARVATRRRDVLRAAYVRLGDPFGGWLRALWRGQVPDDDPLRPLVGQVGEAAAWGDEPHITLTDALTTADPGSFADRVRAVCAAVEPVRVVPAELCLYGLGTALVVRLESSGLASLRRALQDVTRGLVARSPLTDEEWQRAAFWIDRCGGPARDENHRALRRARERYELVGSPPLPSSRHFRLGRLVAFSRALDRAQARGDAVAAERNLHGFLRSQGDPPWYDGADGLHATIASGLSPDDDEGARRLLRNLWPEVERRLPPVSLEEVVVMGEGEESIEVGFFDFLTESYLTERRPKLVVVERIPLGWRGAPER